MGHDDETASGWQFVAQRESAAELVDTLLALDAGTEYTKTDIAESAGIPLKTLYLNDVLDECAELGVLQRIEDPDSGEPRYVVNDDSDLLEAAAAFDDAYRERST